MSDRLCVVMPVYNERDIIASVLQKWETALNSLGLDFVIRPYNDGSRDDSLMVMTAAAERLPHVQVRDKSNGGHGHTILTGYREAVSDGFDWIFQIDSDDEMGPESFDKLWSRRADFDFIVGRRSGRIQALPRKVISFVSRLAVRIFYGKGTVWDVNAPYRLMRATAFATIFRSIPERTFAPNVIITGMAARRRLRACELPVPQYDRQTGEASIKKWKLLKAAAISLWQTMVYAFRVGMPVSWFVAGAVAALAVRFGASLNGFNFDYESYGIVADIVCRGGNVYAETSRYNYAPFWFNVLGFLKTLFGEHMRIGVLLLLSFADIGIAAILWRKYSSLAAFVFLFSPISVYVSGYHNQFDNLAVLVAMIAFSIADAQRQKGRDSLIPPLILGFSLIVKHVFIFMPFWFLFEMGVSLKRRAVKCMVPLLAFMLSFAPYVLSDCIRDVRTIAVQTRQCESVGEARAVAKRYFAEKKSAFGGWMDNVLLYRSQKNGLSYRLGIGGLAMPIFMIGMILFGFVLRQRNWMERFLCYTALLLLFTPALADQYFAIPVAYCAAHLDVFSILYAAGFIRVLGRMTAGSGREFVVVLLAFSLARVSFRPKVGFAATRDGALKCPEEVRREGDN